MQSGIVCGAPPRATTASGARANTSAPIGEASATRLATLAPSAGLAGSAEVKVVAAARIATMDLKPNMICCVEVGSEEVALEL